MFVYKQITFINPFQVVGDRKNLAKIMSLLDNILLCFINLYLIK